MFGYVILGCSVFYFCSVMGIIIADKIESHKRNKKLERELNEPIAVKISIVDENKTTMGYISSNEDFQKLLKQHLTNEIL